ncbi:unnamed protein product [Debaryomyces fabryi]|nr:unnamed protein product [Debaryomyces fabryi]
MIFVLFDFDWNERLKYFEKWIVREGKGLVEYLILVEGGIWRGEWRGVLGVGYCNIWNRN